MPNPLPSFDDFRRDALRPPVTYVPQETMRPAAGPRPYSQWPWWKLVAAGGCLSVVLMMCAVVVVGGIYIANHHLPDRPPEPDIVNPVDPDPDAKPADPAAAEVAQLAFDEYLAAMADDHRQVADMIDAGSVTTAEQMLEELLRRTGNSKKRLDPMYGHADDHARAEDNIHLNDQAAGILRGIASGINRARGK